MPLDVLGVDVVRVWEVVGGSEVVVLLWPPVFNEVVIVPRHAGRKNWSGSYSWESSRVKESHQLQELEDTARKSLLCLLATTKPLHAHQQLSAGAEGTVSLSFTTLPLHLLVDLPSMPAW